MAADKQFQELIDEQKLTNRLLMTDQERTMDDARALANEESAEREAAEKEREKSEEKTRSLLNRLTLGMLGTGGSKKKE